VLAVLALAGPASAAPGGLDPSFAGGRVTTSFGEDSYAFGVDVQPDGKVVAAGTSVVATTEVFALARYRTDGTLDPAFDTDGKVTTANGNFADGEDVVVQPDGKIVAVGGADVGANGDFAFFRYNPDGSPDNSFSGDGKATIAVGGAMSDDARAVAIGPNGELVAVGEADTASGGQVGVAVLKGTGQPETAFNGTGAKMFDGSTGDDQAKGVAVQPDGKIVIADSSGAGAGDGFTILRVTSTGALDPAFNGGAPIRLPIPPGSAGGSGGRSEDVLLQPDGKIVAAGYGVTAGGDTQFAIARFNGSDGSLDTSFSGDGIQTTEFNDQGELGRSVGREPDGKLVLGGSYDADPAASTEHDAAALARYNLDGSPDTSFGSGGKATQPVPAGLTDERVNELAIAPDGRILTAGEAPTASNTSFSVSRFLANPDPPLPAPVVTGRNNGRPDTNMKRIPRVLSGRKLKGFSGTASDPDGVKEVDIALVRLVGKARASRKRSSCLSLRNSRARFKRQRAKRHRCPRLFLKARGSKKWKYKLKRRLPKGRYVVYSRAVDKLGLAENRFSRKDRNRYAFRVR
jgi:uncharacterized delta-60 repeat protein